VATANNNTGAHGRKYLQRQQPLDQQDATTSTTGGFCIFLIFNSSSLICKKLKQNEAPIKKTFKALKKYYSNPSLKYRLFAGDRNKTMYTCKNFRGTLSS
jgi:hypothetical protein